MLSHLSPLGWEHINLNGDYVGVIILSWVQGSTDHYAVSISIVQKTVLAWDIFRFPSGPLVTLQPVFLFRFHQCRDQSVQGINSTRCPASTAFTPRAMASAFFLHPEVPAGSRFRCAPRSQTCQFPDDLTIDARWKVKSTAPAF